MKKNNFIYTLQSFVYRDFLFIGHLAPMWFELDVLSISGRIGVTTSYANKNWGDVEIINGLNHYIGMASLHTENFFRI